jgi:DNA sulfur modification protein DndB
METIYLPALRGAFGDWIYYSCVMRLSDVAARISYASELHTSKGLSDMLQRVLDKERAKKIAEYLEKRKDRFFNTIVVAVYGGESHWFAAGRISAANSDLEVEKIDPAVQESIGFLKLRGDEKLFALDGQHRLAGIRRAVKESDSLGQDVQSVIFVGHKKTAQGVERTRRLFTTLNKTAKPVSKNEIIALDEDDVMAIVCRRLVETNPWFKGDRIAFNETANISAQDRSSLTSIVNLYDILTTRFSRFPPKRPLEDLKYYRATENALEDYYTQACEYFEALASHFTPLNEYFESTQHAKTIAKYRGSFGGDMLFRPIGLSIMTDVLALLCRDLPLKKAVKVAAGLPRDLSEPPYHGVLWDPRTGMTNARSLTRDLLLYMLNALPERKHSEVGKKYARAVGKDPEKWRDSLEVLRDL